MSTQCTMYLMYYGGMSKQITFLGALIAKKCKFFSQNQKNCLECSETKECAKAYFLKNQSFFLSKSSISDFSYFKNIYIHTYKKTCIKLSVR